MADLSAVVRPAFVEEIYKKWESGAADWRRPHLGCSLLGSPCSRFLWYSFRWVRAPKFPGRMLRLFDTGAREESRIVRDLRNIGLDVYDLDPATGKQFRAEFSPHVSGSLDGVGCGFVESPKKWHVLEFKTHNDKSFAALSAQGVLKSKPLHFVQTQLYMRFMSRENPGHFDRAVYIAVNKNDDAIHAERFPLNPALADSFVERGVSVSVASRPPVGISDNPSHPDCLFCAYSGACFGSRMVAGSGRVVVDFRGELEVNCRTCLHSTACPSGAVGADGSGPWVCEGHGGVALSLAQQKAGCPDHLFHPALLSCSGDKWESKEVLDGGRGVVYTGGINHAGGVIEKK